MKRQYILILLVGVSFHTYERENQIYILIVVIEGLTFKALAP